LGEGFGSDHISDAELTTLEHQATDSTLAFHRLTRPDTNGGFHTFTRIAAILHEQMHRSYADALPEQVGKTHALHDDLAAASSGLNGMSRATCDFF
jgi:hypothetical protein